MDDRELIGRILTGDPSAERELYDAHMGRVYRLVHRLAGESDLADDYAQETFIRVFDRLHTFRGHAALSTWIMSIALSVTLDGLRKTKRLRAREIPWDEPPEIATIERKTELDLKAELRRAIDALPVKYRAVLVMHDVEGYTHEEIAAVLGVRPNTSKVQLFRARARMRSALAAYMKE